MYTLSLEDAGEGIVMVVDIVNDQAGSCVR